MSESLLAIDDIIDDFREIIEWAIHFKQDDEVAPEFMPLDGLTIGSIYEKPSTRTRVSFEVGISKLGGNALTLLKNDIQLGKSETVGDTAKVLSRYLGCITYRCFRHEDVVELADKAEVPVINALSDKHHPCQAAADIMTIVEKFGSNEKVKIAWVGDVLFQGSIGRTDFPMGNHDDLIQSIRGKLFPLGDDITFIPGHGPTSTFGQERQTNPFVADSRYG